MVRYVTSRPRPIHAVATAGRHLLQSPLDGRVLVGPLQPEAPADIVLVVASQPEGLDDARRTVPPELFKRVADGEAVLVMDASAEGAAFQTGFATLIHRWLADIGVPPARVVYLTQNRAWEKLYRAFCYALRLQPLHVIPYDLYIREFFRGHERDGPAVFADRLARFQRRAAEREKRFVCLNFSARPAKVLFLLQLIAGDAFDRGFVSFPGFDKARNTRAVKKSAMMVELLRLPGLEDLAADLLPQMDALGAKETALLGPVATAGDRPHHYKPACGDMALDEYDCSWFTVITETEMHGSRRVTEKPFKPIANFSPFVLLGNPGALGLVRDLGFRTFDGVIDEAYDQECDPRRRFQMVYAEVLRLCALTDKALAAAEAALAETLVFNAHRALVEMPAVYRDALEPRLFDAILAIGDGAPAPRGTAADV